jgi:hypothetical protein
LSIIARRIAKSRVQITLKIAYNEGITAKAAMETVFDHNPTPEELRYLFLSGQDPEAYRASHQDQESEYGNIYALYMIRGDRVKALEYLERIRDPKGLFGPKPREGGDAGPKR